MVRELRINFRTAELSQEQRLNGFEFKATTTIDPGPYRWWVAPNKAWRDWEVGDSTPGRIFIKKKGVWSVEPAPGRTSPGIRRLTACSDVPAMEDKR